MTHEKTSRSRRLVTGVVGLITLALLALAIWPLSSPESSDTVRFLGRLHPVLVHLPIGFLVALLVLEVFDLFIRSVILHHATYILAWLAAGAALLAVGAGILLAYPGEYSQELLSWHRWLGVLTAVAAVWILAWKIGQPLHAPHGWSFVYHPLLLLAAALLAGAGHYGGSLTHGSDYLTSYMPDPLRSAFRVPARAAPPALEPITDPEEAVIFATLIKPVLDARCVSCHGPERQRKGLRLDSHPFILEGGESGADLTLISRSLRLPLDDKRRMPPKEKPQLTADEVALLTWWVETGASEDARVRDVPRTGQINRILEEKFGVSSAKEALAMKEWDEIEPIVSSLRTELGVSLQRVARDESAVEIPFLAPDVSFGDAELARLAPLKANFRTLSLGRSRITDEGLAHVAEMKNLVHLDLNNTAITDAGLVHLAGLPRLEYLNLYGTQVTDDGLVNLEQVPSLRRVYLWQTATTEEGVARLRQNLIDEAQIEAWRAEIRDLEQRIGASNVEIALGQELVPDAEAAQASAPVNDKCPVSGRPVDLAQTVTHGGDIIAFCCEKCLAKFEGDPAPVLAELGLKQE